MIDIQKLTGEQIAEYIDQENQKVRLAESNLIGLRLELQRRKELKQIAPTEVKEPEVSG